MYGTSVRMFDRNGEEIIDNVKKPPYNWGILSAKVHRYDDEEPAEISKPIINENMDIIQAKADKYGVLQRLDNFTGENLNEIVDLKEKKEKKKNINESKSKYIPGERLLLTIKKDKPELLERPIYKSFTTNKKDKLRKFLDRIN